MTVDEQADNIALGRGLRIWLGRSGLTQKELAAKASVNKNTIGNILANRGALPATLGNIALALGVDVEQLFYYDLPSHEKDSKAENEAWEANIQKVFVYLRSIDDLDIRERESRRLLKVAESAAEDYDEAVRRSRARKEAAGNNEALPGGGGKGGAGNLAKGGAD